MPACFLYLPARWQHDHFTLGSSHTLVRTQFSIKYSRHTKHILNKKKIALCCVSSVAFFLSTSFCLAIKRKMVENAKMMMTGH